ncbi:MAG TPA: DNA mismatch repair endonuclease MutL [Gemmatimonadaceae bacterium]|nr:DNA mismatch repair endonuclease MutL [Gemmatimonadaceae bacterium]
MPRITILDNTVVDQIAAGEVVERPASVVKELVENALDAGAQFIDVACEDGGRAKIRVADDGCGMERSDAVLALARHATSKIRHSADLVGVASFGFRGEALPAIASVSRLEIDTAAADGRGTRITTAGGTPPNVTDAARRRGTSVTVERLFYNAPARQRFLRSARSEWRGIVDVLTLLALTRRDVRVTATHDGRAALGLPPAPSLRARVGALWGASFAERLVDVEDVSGEIHVSGLVERPADVGTASRRLFLSVNGRAIRDAGLVRAAEAAYRSTIPAGLRPTLLLELTVPTDSLDVNVHPTKAEVRFRDRWTTERAVEHAVRRALGTGASAATFGGRPVSWPGELALPPAVDREVLRQPVAAPDAAPLAPNAATATLDAAEARAEPLPVPPLMQLRRTYITFEHDDGIVLIDQHSAHERVLYERFVRTLDRGEAPSQRLLFPITLHLGPAEGDAFDEHRELFERLGFEIEGFGGHTLIVSAVPMPHPRFDAPRCLRDTLAALTGDRLPSAASRHEHLAATLACKAAIKAGDPLSPDEMRALYTALARTTLPAHDVHGRSTIVQLSWDELERRFGRR